jgi:signal transduction histidine kinase
MLSLNLGMAADRIETDPAGAKLLVEDARDQARQALAELRGLVRGIAPAILLDRGLVPAVSALAGRGPIPVIVSSELPEGLRLPMPSSGRHLRRRGGGHRAKHASAGAARIG